MATFSKPTTASITTASDNAAGRPNRTAGRWAVEAASAVEGVADELGSAALIDATEGTGDLLRLNDSDDKLPVENLPDEVVLSKLPTGAAAGLIPLIQSNGQLLSSLIPEVDGALEIPNSKVTRRVYTSTATWSKPSNLSFLYVRFVGAGGDFGGGISTGSVASPNTRELPRIGLRAYPKTLIIPAWRLGDSVSMFVGGITIGSSVERVGQNIRGSDTQRQAQAFATIDGGTYIDGSIYAPGGTTMEFEVYVERVFDFEDMDESIFATPAEMRAFYANEATQGVTGVDGETDPTTTGYYNLGVQGTYDTDFADFPQYNVEHGVPAAPTARIGFGAPGNNGFIEVFEVSE